MGKQTLDSIKKLVVISIIAFVITSLMEVSVALAQDDDNTGTSDTGTSDTGTEGTSDTGTEGTSDTKTAGTSSGEYARTADTAAQNLGSGGWKNEKNWATTAKQLPGEYGQYARTGDTLTKGLQNGGWRTPKGWKNTLSGNPGSGLPKGSEGEALGTVAGSYFGVDPEVSGKIGKSADLATQPLQGGGWKNEKNWATTAKNDPQYGQVVKVADKATKPLQGGGWTKSAPKISAPKVPKKISAPKVPKKLPF
jgi:hypothetical protein